MTDNVSIWTALADSKRRQIVNLLEEQPRTTSDLSEFFDVSRFAIMKHLKVLEQADLIKVRREGRQRWNILNDDLVHFLRTKLTDDDGPYRLVDILGLVPGRNSTASATTTVPAVSMHIEQSVLLPAAPAQVFNALTVDIDSWWRQRVSADSRICLEPYVNGRFYEAFDAAGQGILYATVTYIKQDEELRLRGTLELTERVADVLIPDNYIHFVLKPQDNATQFTLGHYITGGVDETTRDACFHGWHRLLNQHLKPFIETGPPYQHDP
jgi:DNA-binding transcriptional ArsR family regulator